MSETMTSGLTLELWYQEKPDQSGFYCYMPIFGKPDDEGSGSGFTLEEAEEDFFLKYNRSHAMGELKFREEESDDYELLGDNVGEQRKFQVDIAVNVKRGKIHLTKQTWDRVHSEEGCELKEYFQKFLKAFPVNQY